MSYNILNKGVKFQGDTQGTIEDMVDTHSTQTINGLKTITHLTGTHARVTNDLNVYGNVSASINISASAFYGDGSSLSNIGTVSFDGSTANGLLTYKDADEATVESNLTFNGSVLDFKATSISGSGNISGSAFYGNGANLTNVAATSVTLASNGGLGNSSGILVDPGNATEITTADDDDYLLVRDDTDGNLKKIKAQYIAGLFNAAVTTYGGNNSGRVIVANGAGDIQGKADLTFSSSPTAKLTLNGELSGSGNISGSAFYGDGSNLTGVLTSVGGITTLGDGTANGILGGGSDTNQIVFGAGSDFKMFYDEATSDSLVIAGGLSADNVVTIISAAENQAAGLLIVSDQMDDAGDAWQLTSKVDQTFTIGNDIASQGTIVDLLTITPHATATSSTVAVAGSLTTGGDIQVGGNDIKNSAGTATITMDASANVTIAGD